MLSINTNTINVYIQTKLQVLNNNERYIYAYFKINTMVTVSVVLVILCIIDILLSFYYRDQYNTCILAVVISF